MWKTTIVSITPNVVNPQEYDVSVIYTSPNGTQYPDLFTMAPNIDDLNKVLSDNLAAAQSKDAFVLLQPGDYSFGKDAPVFEAQPILAEAEQQVIPE